MSISDEIVVMKAGEVQQIGPPQTVYDDPVNLFVAKFLGTPAINVFEGEVKGGVLYIGEDAVLDVPPVADQKVWVGVRPEGFILREDGRLRCGLRAVEVMGRDKSVVCGHPAMAVETVRAILSSEQQPDPHAATVRFDLKPQKVHLFHRKSEQRIPFGEKAGERA